MFIYRLHIEIYLYILYIYILLIIEMFWIVLALLSEPFLTSKDPQRGVSHKHHTCFLTPRNIRLISSASLCDLLQ